MIAQLDPLLLKTRPWKAWPRLLAYLLFEGRPLTTRGRWINPLVLAGYRLWGALPLRAAPVRPIFILGTGRSGTTVLARALGMHREVGFLNEPKALWHAATGEDDLIGSYSAQPGRFRMTAADARPEVARRLNRYYRAYLRLSGCRRVVDKYPELLFRTDLLDRGFPEGRKIVLIRSGHDVCRSVAGWSRANGRAGADWWGRQGRKWHLLVEQLVRPDPAFAPLLPHLGEIRRQEDMAAVEWIVAMREVLRMRAMARPRTLYVRYESLLRHPRRELRRIMDFCGLEPDDTALACAARLLRPPRRADTAPGLHPALQPLFDDTMHRLGYAPARP